MLRKRRKGGFCYGGSAVNAVAVIFHRCACDYFFGGRTGTSGGSGGGGGGGRGALGDDVKAMLRDHLAMLEEERTRHAADRARLEEANEAMAARLSEATAAAEERERVLAERQAVLEAQVQAQADALDGLRGDYGYVPACLPVCLSACGCCSAFFLCVL